MTYLQMHRRNCPVCDKNNQENLLLKEFNYVKCQKCRMIYSDLIPDAKELKKHYEDAEHWKIKILDKTEQKRKLKISRKHAKILKKFTDKNNSTLDIGCGSGDFLAQLKKIGFTNLHGIEPNKTMQTHIQNQSNIKIYGDISEVNNQTFDCISLVKVIEHLSDPNMMVDKCYKLLNKNGLLFLVFPRIGGLGEKVLQENFYGFQKEHINWFTKKTVKLFLEKHNFKIIKIKTENIDTYSILKHIFNFKKEKRKNNSQIISCTSTPNTNKTDIKNIIKKPLSLFFYRILCPLTGYFAGKCGMGDYLIVIARKQCTPTFSPEPKQ